MNDTEPRALRILHLSDTHLFGDGTLHYGVVDTRAALRRVLERAAAIEGLDVVVASGDLSDDGTDASYRRLRDAIEPWAAERGAAVVYAMGNHDGRAAFERVLGPRETVTEVRGRRVITLDSSVPGAGYGMLDTAALHRLRALLHEPAAAGTVLVVHHPPVPAATALLAALELRNAGDLLAAAAASDVRVILSGHYHLGLAQNAGGIPVVVAPGVTNTSDAIAPAGRERAFAGAGFAIVDVPAAGGVRAVFVAAPGPGDGTMLFDLDEREIARIADAAGA